MSSKQESSKGTEKSQTSDTKLLFMMLGGMIVEIGIVVGLLGVTGVINFSGTDEEAKIVVAVIALVGTLIATTVTIIGFMFKRSMDARNFILQSGAEERLKLDTAINAVELFKTASGSPSPAESAGALFALSNLGHSHFALSLLEELWPKGKIETPSAVWLINNSLKSKESGAAEIAADVLNANSERLLDKQGGKWWPSDFYQELPNDLPYSAREWMLYARVKTLLSANYDYWLEESINTDIIALSNTFREDSSPEIKQSAAAFLAILLEMYDPHAESEILLPTGSFAIEEVRAEIIKEYGTQFRAGSDQDQDLVEKLDRWVKRDPYFEKLRATEKAKDIEDEIVG